MLTWINIIILCLVLIGMGCYIPTLTEEDQRTYRNTLIVFFVLIFGTLLWNIMSFCNPKPIDVYRGYTELEVTSVNGVPTDTIVVWKEEFYKPRR